MLLKIFSPNILTSLRIILLIPCLYLLFNNQFIYSFIIALFAVSTDFLDGYLARKYNLITRFGSILDPIADKVLIISLLTCFYLLNLIPIWFILLSNMRDILQLLSIPILLLYKKINFKVKPKIIPKWATAIKFIIVLICFSLCIFKSYQISDLYFLPILVVSALLEIYILVTFIPRFILIYRKKHDTFE
ncbi:CDP-alcohol phosphatidyltransferase family protein [Fluviispira multicolorata]|uniref:CDP-diacylglycerol--glycerol-3-phosphate 3-phosphatidyltransferase n=1 Tax=Fluviispira multicolorata TaxID=2654512 RepID=A0A833JCX2_9BACT|nr:CDP-alcohol phosphatidyltransferase family protein [Fluviispira multicolorata]KAB8030971.1 hypothetical protein GCL57_08360 [Fluviispira multicolorata]